MTDWPPPGIDWYYADDWTCIACADCRDVLPELASVHATITDPPYGMKKASWDMDMIPPEHWLPVSRSLGPVALFCGVKAIFDYPRPDWTMAWVRLGSTQRNGALKGFNNWEPILIYGASSLSNDVIATPNYPDAESQDHPTPKPLKLMKALISRFPQEVICDPFCGVGTTLRAAKDIGRRCIGIEISEKYAAIAKERLRQEVLVLK